MTPSERDDVRQLLVQYHRLTALAEQLVLAMSDLVRHAAGELVSPINPQSYRERLTQGRHALDDADAYVTTLWDRLGLERRDRTRQVKVAVERRRKP